MNGSDASIQRRAYAGKSTLTASTLLLGSPISPSTTTIGQFVFGEPEVTTDDLLAARALEWIGHVGPNASGDQTCGNKEIVLKFWNLLRESEILHGEIATLKEKYEQRCLQIDKAMTVQVSKWGNTSADEKTESAKLKELDKWCSEKNLKQRGHWKSRPISGKAIVKRWIL